MRSQGEGRPRKAPRGDPRGPGPRASVNELVSIDEETACAFIEAHHVRWLRAMNDPIAIPALSAPPPALLRQEAARRL